MTKKCIISEKKDGYAAYKMILVVGSISIELRWKDMLCANIAQIYKKVSAIFAQLLVIPRHYHVWL